MFLGDVAGFAILKKMKLIFFSVHNIFIILLIHHMATAFTFFQGFLCAFIRFLNEGDGEYEVFDRSV